MGVSSYDNINEKAEDTLETGSAESSDAAKEAVEVPTVEGEVPPEKIEEESTVAEPVEEASTEVTPNVGSDEAKAAEVAAQ